MYDVNVYYLPTEGEAKVGRYFRAREFRCFDGCQQVFIAPKLVKLLDVLRDNIGCAIYVNSGYRTTAHNTKVNGAKNSMHLYGCAADIRPANNELAKLYELADLHLNNSGGLGKYKTFIHVDVRTKKSRWEG